MGFIKNLVLSRVSKIHENELDEMLIRLKGMDRDEIAFLLVLAAELRNSTVLLRDDLLDFHQLSDVKHASASLTLSTTIRKLQADNCTAAAGALMIWLHTARAGQDHRLRFKAKQMWTELSRGFGHVRTAELQYLEMFRRPATTTGIYRIPAGLDETR